MNITVDLPHPAVRIRRYAVLGILAVLLLDVALRASGTHTLCRQCGSQSTHLLLVAAGLTAWSTFLFLDRRLPERAVTLLLGLLSGVHLGLATYLLALPRLCLTCILVCALALIPIGVMAYEGRHLLAVLSAMTASVVAVHVLGGITGIL